MRFSPLAFVGSVGFVALTAAAAPPGTKEASCPERQEQVGSKGECKKKCAAGHARVGTSDECRPAARLQCPPGQWENPEEPGKCVPR